MSDWLADELDRAGVNIRVMTARLIMHMEETRPGLLAKMKDEGEPLYERLLDILLQEETGDGEN